MSNEICNLSPDESWVLQEYRKVKSEGFAEMSVKIQAGVAERITVTQSHKRIAGMRVTLKE